MGGGFTWHPLPLLYLEATVGPRVGISDELYLNLALLGGASVLLGKRKLRHGLFLRGGSTLPLPRYHEIMVMTGYALRGRVGDELGMGLDVGAGWLTLQELPVDYQPYPAIAVLRLSMDIGL